MNDTQRKRITEIKTQLKLLCAELRTMAENESDAATREALRDAADMLRDIDPCLRDAKSTAGQGAARLKNPAAVALGSMTSKAKAASSVANGRKGGRPRKDTKRPT